MSTENPTCVVMRGINKKTCHMCGVFNIEWLKQILPCASPVPFEVKNKSWFGVLNVLALMVKDWTILREASYAILAESNGVTWHSV